MIARQWIGETWESDGGPYAKYLGETGVRHCKGIGGNCGVLLLKRIYDGKAQFIFISFWDSFEAIKAFAGLEYEKAVYYEEDKIFFWHWNRGLFTAKANIVSSCRSGYPKASTGPFLGKVSALSEARFRE